MDDNYDDFVHLMGNDQWEVIPTRAVHSTGAALFMIRTHPEADKILLDGTFISPMGVRDYCSSVVEELTEEERMKIICFSDEPDNWKPVLSQYGMRHFPGKGGDFYACIMDTCSCA